MTIKVRTFNADDYDAVVDLWTAAGITLNESDTMPELLKSLQRDPELFIVAESEQALLGAVLGRFDGRRGHVNHLAVHPKYQSQSIGRMLMDELTKRLEHLGCLKVNLHVTPDNEKVMGFYRRLGYEPSTLFFMSKWI
jgi:ribosomal protein S18 acetylase RimI-like enzyme